MSIPDSYTVPPSFDIQEDGDLPRLDLGHAVSAKFKKWERDLRTRLRYPGGLRSAKTSLAWAHRERTIHKEIARKKDGLFTPRMVEIC